jgi:hypothetical protein
MCHIAPRKLSPPTHSTRRSSHTFDSPYQASVKAHSTRLPSHPRTYVPYRAHNHHILPVDHRPQAWIPRRPSQHFPSISVSHKRFLHCQSVNGNYYYSRRHLRSSGAFVLGRHLNLLGTCSSLNFPGVPLCYETRFGELYVLKPRKPPPMRHSCKACKFNATYPDATVSVRASRVTKDARSGCVSCLTISKAMSNFHTTWKKDARFRFVFSWYPRPELELLLDGQSLSPSLQLEFFSLDGQTPPEEYPSILELRASSGLWRNLGNSADASAPHPLDPCIPSYYAGCVTAMKTIPIVGILCIACLTELLRWILMGQGM